MGGACISYETSNPYMACSSESTEGICKGGDWSCTDENVARTCSTFPPSGFCGPVKTYPNATIEEYGSVEGANNMAKEIMARGPISCGISATHGASTGARWDTSVSRRATMLQL